MDRKRSAPDIGYLKVGIGGDGDRFNGFTGTQQPGHNHKTLIVGGAISSGAGGKGEDLIGGIHLHIKIMEAAVTGLADDVFHISFRLIVVEGHLCIEAGEDLEGHLLFFGGIINVRIALGHVQPVIAGKLGKQDRKSTRLNSSHRL